MKNLFTHPAFDDLKLVLRNNEASKGDGDNVDASSTSESKQQEEENKNNLLSTFIDKLPLGKMKELMNTIKDGKLLTMAHMSQEDLDKSTKDILKNKKDNISLPLDLTPLGKGEVN